VVLVVFLRGLNVGGHRTFRPARLAERLRHLDVVNFGATGTFVVRRSVTREHLRREIARRLPFEAEIIICRDGEIRELVARDVFAGRPERPEIVRFVSVLSRVPRSAPRLPMTLPPRGRWLLKVLALERRFVVGLHRRDMRVIGYLGELDRIFGAPATTRSWSTLVAIAKSLDEEKTP
jgi:hypothetical protein